MLVFKPLVRPENFEVKTTRYQRESARKTSVSNLDDPSESTKINEIDRRRLQAFVSNSEKNIAIFDLRTSLTMIS